MSSQALRVVWRAEAQVPARSKHIEKQLKRFTPAVNGAVRALAARHTRLADLTLSFPALAVGLAMPSRSAAVREAAASVIAGLPLEEAAGAARIPLWTRHLPPECFSGTVPILPRSADFYRRIANHIPAPRQAAEWFKAVSFAAYWGSEAFGVWMAREYFGGRKNVPSWQRVGCKVLTLWAFQSALPGSPAHTLLDRGWTPGIGLKAALDAAYTWWTAVDLHVRMGEALIGDPWLTPGEVDGYRFGPLLSAREILDEARAMKNCLRTYGGAVAENQTRVWSVRKEGRRVAVLEVNRPLDGRMMNIWQLEGPLNRPASQAVWWATQQWLHRHDLAALAKRVPFAATAPDGATWRKLWKPFWLAKGRVPAWLPLSPSESVLNSF